MRKIPFLILLYACLNVLVLGQIESAVFSNGSSRQISVAIKRERPIDLARLNITVYKKTDEGNIEIQSPQPISDANIQQSGGKTIITVRVTEDLDLTASYFVAVSGYQAKIAGETKFLSFAPFDMKSSVTSSLLFNPRSCASGIQLQFELPEANNEAETKIVRWIKSFESNPSKIAKLETVQGNSKWRERRITFVKEPLKISLPTGFTYLRTCFEIDEPISGVYNIRLTFDKSSDTPAVLAETLTKESFGVKDKNTPSDITKDDAFVRKGDPGQRSLKNDIEAGFTFTNSKNQETGKRVSRGVLDLQIAPIRNKPFLFGKGDKPIYTNDKDIPKWFGYWTPLFLDANISTGKITKDTLSLNRIAIGGNFEFRYVPVNYDKEGKSVLTRFPNYNIFKLNYTHYSDRDFKQNEISAGAEYSPIFGSLNRSRKMNFRYVPFIPTCKNPEDVSTCKKEVRAPGKYGYSFVPSIGFEFGRTYSRRNPAEAVKPSDTIKRLFSKFTANYEFGRYNIKLTDQMFYRGESKTDRFRNYFEADFETFLNDISRNFKHAVFLNYKLGRLPPFNTRADSVTVGYRVRFNR